MTKKILIVDDNDTVRTLLKMSLKSERFVVLEASDGLSALDIVNVEKPDLIISDILMPNMDGFEFCRKVRETSPVPTVPFIFLSSLGEVSTELRGYRTGADDYLVKSNLKRPELLAKVESMLEKGQEYKKIESSIEDGMVGKLSDLSIIEVIQLLGMNKKNGTLRVSKDEALGQIYFSNGQIVHSEFKDLRGEEAVYSLSEWTTGVFKFEPVEVNVEQTIQTSTMNIIMECCRLLDEKQSNSNG
jgi:DNA-binding response OmpR family regulator